MDMASYVRTTHEEMESLSFVRSVSRDFSSDQFLITWNVMAARELMMDIRGHAHVLDRRRIETLPNALSAQNWWHVCSIVGLTEPVARVLYREEPNPACP